MALDNAALLELLEAMQAAGVEDRIRTAAQTIYQALIDAELTAVITHTIDRWDGKEAADKIELHVGRDLQFIRINGTIVGGLVGVLIHTVAVLAT